MVAGGVESMTRAPLVIPKPDTAFPSGNVTVFDSSLGWRFPNPKLAALFPLEAMGETAENLAAKYNVSRAEQDAFALRSHEKHWPRRKRTVLPMSWSPSICHRPAKDSQQPS